ncbi:MAG: hypothetical protein Q4C50_11815, partial [Eubacteriales bacterium]|nr:hypothetical protein [Eubacteriales bacterium]
EHQPSKLDTWVRFPSPAFSMPIHVKNYLKTPIEPRDYHVVFLIQKAVCRSVQFPRQADRL